MTYLLTITLNLLKIQQMKFKSSDQKNIWLNHIGSCNEHQLLIYFKINLLNKQYYNFHFNYISK